MKLYRTVLRSRVISSDGKALKYGKLVDLDLQNQMKLLSGAKYLVKCFLSSKKGSRTKHNWHSTIEFFAEYYSPE